MDIEANHLYPDRLQSLEMYMQLGWAAALISTLLILFLLFRATRRLRGVRPGQLHQCESASASLEFLLVFFPLLTIVLAVWQLAFMLNAQLQVGYAAYAAGRSASTVAYMELPDEPEGSLISSSEDAAEKWKRINRAAIPGVLAISPGNLESAAKAYVSAQVDRGIAEEAVPDFPPLDLAALPGQFILMTAHREDAILQGNREQRFLVKALYAERATRVLINGQDESGPLNVASAETLSVTVEYDFWLHVPYAGRLMKIAFDGQRGQLTGRWAPTLALRETVVVNAWPRIKAY